MSDDDTRLVGGDVVQFVRICETAGFDLAQPARERGTHFNHPVTRRSRFSRARATSFVESGPLFAVGTRYRDRVLPLPEHRGMRWSVESDWFDLSEDGCRLGIVDAIPVQDVGSPIKGYEGRPYWAGMRETVEVWRPWQRRPPWADASNDRDPGGVATTAVTQPEQSTDIAGLVDGHPERFVPHLMSGQPIDAEHRARYWWAAAFVGGKKVLDAACGTGYGANILAAAGATSVRGIDRAAHMIEFARRNAEPTAEFEVGDLDELPFADGSFDVVVCFEAIEHVDEPESVLDELARVLRPGGLLATSSPNRDVYARSNPHHRHEFAPEEFRSALRARFKYVRLLRQHDWLATAILEDEAFTEGAGEAIAAGTARKVSAIQPGRETYTVALASDEVLPPTAPIVVLARDLDIRRLVDEADRARVGATKMRGQFKRCRARGSYGMPWRCARATPGSGAEPGRRRTQGTADGHDHSTASAREGSPGTSCPSRGLRVESLVAAASSPRFAAAQPAKRRTAGVTAKAGADRAA